MSTPGFIYRVTLGVVLGLGLFIAVRGTHHPIPLAVVCGFGVVYLHADHAVRERRKARRRQEESDAARKALVQRRAGHSDGSS